MTFHAKPDGFFFRLDIMWHQDGIIDPCMAFNASYVLKVKELVWQPVVCFGNIGIVFISQ